VASKAGESLPRWHHRAHYLPAQALCHAHAVNAAPRKLLAGNLAMEGDMKHECAHCKATLNTLILQVRKDGRYELRCDFHTQKDWKTVAALAKQPVEAGGVVHMARGNA